MWHRASRHARRIFNLYSRVYTPYQHRQRRHHGAALKTTPAAVVIALLVYTSYTQHRDQLQSEAATTASSPSVSVPSRAQSVSAFHASSPSSPFDVLVIGGGATGSGIALDASLRGLSVALVEANDFSSGTSSRSTKLVHGGIRYLQKAVIQLDMGQYRLVHEAQAERKHLLAIAPHLAHSTPIIVPLYGHYPWVLFYGPYYWLGCKMYDLVAGRSSLIQPSYWLSRSAALDKFPMLKPDNLHGGVVYYDGQQNDTRMNISLILTAAAHGARVANYVRVLSLIKNKENRVCGARVRDHLTGEEWSLHAKEVINATGPYTDHIRQMANPALSSCITPSAGVHIVVPGSCCPSDMGLIVPETSDGRVLFMLPWEGSTLIGTTDYLSPITELPCPQESDVTFLLGEINRMLKQPIQREQVKSAWSGIRPLATPVAASPTNKDTQTVSRDHMIEHTAPGMLSISGGKWTTYRKMAEDVLNVMIHDQQQEAKTATATRPPWFIDTTQVKPCSTWVRATTHTRATQRS